MNEATQAVRAYFERSEVKPQLEVLCREWNEHELLGIDLADSLRRVFEEVAKESPTTSPFSLDEVDWNQLAEIFAYEICGITEDDLIRRREQYSK